LGADRIALAFLVNAYDEEALTDDAKSTDEVRTVMHFHPALAPFKAAVLPLTKKQTAEAEELHRELSKHFMTDFDTAGNIGKRYRREDEIGTPFCVTVDFDTAEDGAVTVRDRDTMEQIRLPIGEVREYIEKRLEF
jgi:glycyl-tRNA synthetase